jgi:aryl-alcohol dehydrogenase-like predicted oxidoreductase
MQKKPLGKTGATILPLVLGGNVFGWTADEATSFQILDRFADAGGTLIDTADVYSGFAPGGKYGESERIIGNWIKSRNNRSKVLIATKVGYEMSPDKKGLSRKYIMQAVEDSLTRLQTDSIDLYQSHRDDLSTPLEETLEAYTSLIKAGKVRWIGASQCAPDRLARGLEISKDKGFASYATLQPHYNLYERADYESQFKTICEEQGLGVIPYFGLARGFLTGKYRCEADLAKSVRGSGIKDFLNERGFRILAALDQVAKIESATPAQISLAWLMSRPSITAPIASATSVGQLEDLLKSTTLQLSEESISILGQIDLKPKA